MSRRVVIRLLLISGMVACVTHRVAAYSVLAHEATIDIAWELHIRPLLRARYPQASPQDLTRARAFVYGGSLVQDLGYYPFGNKFFSNLLHYTRSGDFVEALLRDARDIDEYAFAVGALAHYATDNTGHPEAVNLALPIIFPKLRAKYGDRVTYEQAPTEHVLVEFSFDVAHSARTVYPLTAYRNLIGFDVATPLLERAFREVYGLELKDLFGDLDRAVSSYRYAVSQILPAITQQAWKDKHEEIEKANPGATQHTFVLVYQRANFEHDYGRHYRRPALFARLVAFLYRLLPKIGPLKPLSFRAPTPDADALFVRSVRDGDARFAGVLADVRANRLDLINVNFDTGRPTRRGDYSLADDTYAELLDHLAKNHFAWTTPALRRHLLTFYREEDSATTNTNRKSRRTGRRVQDELAELAAP